MDLTHAFIGCLAAAISWLGLGWAAWRLAARLYPREECSVRLIVAAVVGAGFIVLTCEILGAFGALRPAAVCLTCLLFMGASWRLRSSVSVADEAGAIGQRLRHRIGDGYGALACVVAILAAQAVGRAMRCPPLSWDSLTYHAFLPARWVQLGELAAFSSPGGMDTYRAYPINFELLAAWAILPFHSDAFLNLVNMPVLLATGLALYALSRELGVGPRMALWPPMLVCLSPPLWALVTTQYSDIFLCGCVLAGLLFIARFARTAQRCDLFLSAAAFGLAMGCRYSAMAWSGLALAAATVIGLRHFGSAQALRPLAVALIIGLVLGGYQYLRNWSELGNPLYPLELSIGGQVIFDGSPRVAEVLRVYPGGTRADDLQHAALTLSNGPLSWGFKYVLLIPLALLAILRRGPRRGVMICLAALAFVGLALFYGPGSGLTAHVRRCWLETSQRLLAVPASVVACLAAVEMSRWRWPRQLAAAPLTVAVFVDGWRGEYSQPLSALGMTVVLVTALLALYFAHGGQLRHIGGGIIARPAAVVVAAALLFACAGWGVGGLHEARRIRRYASYASATDYHEIPRDFVAGWMACDDEASSHVIAAAWKHRPDDRHSIVTSGTRWMLYPLLGSRLQNRVVHASIRELADHPSPRYHGELSDDADERVWLQNLRRLEVDRFFLGDSAPPEAGWIAARPEVFVPLAEDAGCRVFQVRQDALAAAIRESERTPLLAATEVR